MHVNYKLNEPRISISVYNPETGEHREREIGQAASQHEALFWLALGYDVRVYWWNGKCFAQ